MRIYLVGSHSVGKTTLCRYISEKYNLPILNEAARSVLAEMELPLTSLRTDLAALNKFQKKVMERQLEIEGKTEESFVSDRSFDFLAYAGEHSTITYDLFNPDFGRYIEKVKQGIVFFVRPDKSLLHEDGVRETPTWESVLRIDGMVKLLLEMFKVDYMPIHAVSMQERARIVDFVIGKSL